MLCVSCHERLGATSGFLKAFGLEKGNPFELKVMKNVHVELDNIRKNLLFVRYNLTDINHPGVYGFTVKGIAKDENILEFTLPNVAKEFRGPYNHGSPRKPVILPEKARGRKFYYNKNTDKFYSNE